MISNIINSLIGGYPQNLIRCILGKEYTDIKVTKDMISRLDSVLLSLDERVQLILRLRFNSKLSYTELGNRVNLSKSRTAQILDKAILVLRRKQTKFLLGVAITPSLDTPLEDIKEMSVRVYNCLKRKQLNTLGDVVNYIEKHGYSWTNIRNLGKASEAEVYTILYKYLGYTLKCAKSDIYQSNNG